MSKVLIVCRGRRDEGAVNTTIDSGLMTDLYLLALCTEEVFWEDQDPGGQ